MGNLITCNSSVEDDLRLSLHNLLHVAMTELKKDILHCIRIEITKSNSKSDSEPPIKD